MDDGKTLNPSLWQMIKGWLVLSLCLIPLVIILVNRGPDKDSSVTTSQPESKPKKWATWDGEGETPNAKVIVMLGEMTRNEYLSGFGKVRVAVGNATGEKLSYIQVSIGIYVNNTKVGSCFVNQNYIASGGTWEADATCTGIPPSDCTYGVDDVTYW